MSPQSESATLGVDLVGNRTLLDLLHEQADAHPDRTFVVAEDREGAVSALTYAEFSDGVDRVAGGLAELGIGFGDPVLLHLRNSHEFLLAWFALGSLGAVACPSNTALTAHELGFVAARTEAACAITEPQYLDVLRTVADAAPALQTLIVARADVPPAGTVSFAALREHDPAPAPERRISSSDVLQILFTSGTTAQPKGVVICHANALWSGERVARAYGLQDTDRCLTALPLFHVNAQSVTVLGALTVGATCVLLEEFRASRYWDQVRRHRATQMSMVATVAKALLAQPPRENDAEHELRRTSLAINIPEDERLEFERRHGVSLINLYGLTEAAEIVAISPLFGPRRWPALGLPAFDRRVRIVDEDGAELGAGDAGEILVHGVPGRTVMLRYHDDPEATAETLVDGWVRTGDHGYLDDAGYLYFADRKKDVIKRAGDSVSATEVEAALETHPSIREAAVLGVPDAFRGEAVKAFLVLEESSSLTTEEITEHCAVRLARFKIPTEIEFRETLPRNAIGKLQKHHL